MRLNARLQILFFKHEAFYHFISTQNKKRAELSFPARNCTSSNGTLVSPEERGNGERRRRLSERASQRSIQTFHHLYRRSRRYYNFRTLANWVAFDFVFWFSLFNSRSLSSEEKRHGNIGTRDGLHFRLGLQIYWYLSLAVPIAIKLRIRNNNRTQIVWRIALKLTEC